MNLSSSTDSLVEAKNTSLIPFAREHSVRHIGLSECKEVGTALSLAFAADEYCQYLLDSSGQPVEQAEQTWKVFVWLMSSVATANCYNGIVSTIGPDHDAVALWYVSPTRYPGQTDDQPRLPPGRDLDGWWTSLRSGLWRLRYKLSPEAKRRYYGEIIPLLHETKLQVMADRDAACYYLLYIGTKPTARGQGHARKLLEDMIERVSRPPGEGNGLLTVGFASGGGFRVPPAEESLRIVIG